MPHNIANTSVKFTGTSVRDRLVNSKICRKICKTLSPVMAAGLVPISLITVWFCIVIFFNFFTIFFGETSRLVELEQGLVRGYKDKDGDIFAFYGIPYATGPTGPNKFKAPLPPPTWKDTFEAIDKGIICPQANYPPIIPTDKIRQEDCLIANVFVPDTRQENLPVYVIIHGGGFQIGYGNWISTRHLIRANNMIVVTFNYRLGKHGFLCLGTEDAPGNAGLKDQVALLRWVKNNIAAFGGNPDDITLGGFSAGGTSVQLLMLSKIAKDLFHKVIVESSYMLSGFSVQTNPIEVAKTFARRRNFTNVNNLQALERFYKSASLDDLTMDSFITEIDSSYFFTPCIERDLGGEVLLDTDPLGIIKSGNYQKVPMLLGISNMEGLTRLGFFEEWKNGMNENFSNYLPPELEFKNEEQKNKIAKQTKEFYFGNDTVNNDTACYYVDYISDVFFNGPVLWSVKYYFANDHNDIFLYEYSFAEEDSFISSYKNISGASHHAQTAAIFDGTGFIQPDESQLSPKYRKVKSMMRELWGNFITTGKPVSSTSSWPAWPPMSSNWSPHMSLEEKMELKGTLLDRRIRFWDDIYEKFYRTPIAPPKPYEDSTNK